MNLKGKSANELRIIAKKALLLANDLEESQPSYELAILNGIEDRSYNTVANGRVYSYRGTVDITMEDGSKWKCVGHKPEGDAYSINRDGYIEFIPIL